MKYINLITGKVLEIDENASCKTCEGFLNNRCVINKNIRHIIEENDLCFAYKQKILSSNERESDRKHSKAKELKSDLKKVGILSTHVPFMWHPPVIVVN